jgi:hypothetical protein
VQATISFSFFTLNIRRAKIKLLLFMMFKLTLWNVGQEFGNHGSGGRQAIVNAPLKF